MNKDTKNGTKECDMRFGLLYICCSTMFYFSWISNYASILMILLMTFFSGIFVFKTKKIVKERCFDRHLFFISIALSTAGIAHLIYVLSYSSKMVKLFGEFPFIKLILPIILLTVGMASLFYAYCTLSSLSMTFSSQVHTEARNKQDKAGFILNNKKLIIMTLMLSFFYLLAVSDFSPLSSSIAMDGDASIFYSVAYFWKKGLIPYKEAFDHKGPIIYCIYLLGIVLGENIGIFLLEILALCISLIYIFKIAKILSESSFVGCVAIVISLLYSNLVQYGWGLTEEFNLPFLVICTYIVIVFCKSKSYSNIIFYALFMGVSFAVSLGLRVTNAISICLFAFGIACHLIFEKRIREFMYCMVSFLAGMLVVILPFIVYFAYNNALYDLAWGTVLYNMEYSSASKGAMSISQILCAYSLCLPCIVASISSLFLKKDKLLSTLIILASVGSVYIVISGYLYLHYFIILIPFIPLACGLIGEIYCCDNIHHLKIPASLLIGILIVICFGGVIEQISATDESNDYKIAVNEILESIPEESINNVIAYNTDYGKFYRYSGIIPCFKYFSLQDWQSSQSLSMEEENVAFYLSGTAEYIIIQGNVENENIWNSIITKYSLIKEVSISETEDTFYLYKLVLS